ncbi:MAG: hypothetical protein BAJALOKI3v1_580017 [Promethearchaeota archaeon]|nr:MAG: hypothetical protein BAJALOKI3v1_580017 [Candidatus Lokiarchaeota archaeon]
MVLKLFQRTLDFQNIQIGIILAALKKVLVLIINYKKIN